MANRSTVYNRLYTPELWDQVNKDNKTLLEDFLIEKKAQKKKKSTIEQYKILEKIHQFKNIISKLAPQINSIN